MVDRSISVDPVTVPLASVSKTVTVPAALKAALGSTVSADVKDWGAGSADAELAAALSVSVTPAARASSSCCRAGSSSSRSSTSAPISPPVSLAVTSSPLTMMPPIPAPEPASYSAAALMEPYGAYDSSCGEEVSSGSPSAL